MGGTYYPEITPLGEEEGEEEDKDEDDSSDDEESSDSSSSDRRIGRTIVQPHLEECDRGGWPRWASMGRDSASLSFKLLGPDLHTAGKPRPVQLKR